MGIFQHKQQNSSSDIESSEITLPNGENDLSRGYFITLLKTSALTKKQPIVSSIVNHPVFQISVNINPQNNPPRIVVLLGDTISDPKDKKTFEIPSDLDFDSPHEVKVEWKNNRISELFIDSKPINLFTSKLNLN